MREIRALEAARAEATTASEAWESRWRAARSALGDDPSLSSADSWSVLEPALTAARDRSARQLGSLAEAQADELRLEKLRAEQEARQAKLTSVAAEGAAELAALAALPEQLAAVRAAREHAAIEAATLEQRRTDAEQARGRREAATEAGRLERELASAQAHAAELATTAAAAASEVSDLLARRIAGMAGELADALQPGEPCTVCGSATHPNPATHADPVTPDAIAEAETAQRAAQQRLDSAREAERGIESALAAARVAAAGLEPEAAADALDDATAQYEQAKAAATQLTTLSEQLAALDAETATRTARVGELSAQEAALSANIDSATTQAASLEAELLAARAGSDSIRARLDALEAEHAALEAALRAGNALGSATRAVEAAKTLVAAELVAQGFAEPDSSADALTLAESAATSAHLDATAQATLRAAVRKFDEDTQRNAGELAAPDLHGIERTPVDLEPAATASAAATAQADAALSAHAAAARIASEHRATLDRVERELAGSAATGEALLRLRRLADTMQGKDPNTKRMRLEVFVLAARLEAIVEAANRRLSTMVGGRYRLAHDDGLRARGRQSGLGLAVIDEYTGRERSTDSLSGGESFLASLALALGLADVVTAESGGLELDTLFIDEGFGSLDPDALDQALATLDGLREGGRTVALISHVTELKERLAGGLEVVADGQGISSIRGDGVLSPDDPSHTSDAATTD
ncbi:AAA family ATPase [Leucobacter sp. BZR 635]